MSADGDLSRRSHRRCSITPLKLCTPAPTWVHLTRFFVGSSLKRKQDFFHYYCALFNREYVQFKLTSPAIHKYPGFLQNFFQIQYSFWANFITIVTPGVLTRRISSREISNKFASLKIKNPRIEKVKKSSKEIADERSDMHTHRDFLWPLYTPKKEGYKGKAGGGVGGCFCSSCYIDPRSWPQQENSTREHHGKSKRNQSPYHSLPV